MKRRRKNLVITLLVTFVLMTLLVVFTSRVVYRTAFTAAQELGEDKAAAITADLENYLDTAKSVLWLTADTVEHMVEKGATNEDIIEYITRESKQTEEQFDSSYTGIYGVIRGTYVDGVGWVPPEDYDPTERDWYKTTIAGKGEVVIVSPYVDAQTGNVIISVGRALSDGNSAMALDLTLNGVQEVAENVRINGYGYGFVMNRDGMIIAHRDKEENGKYYNELPEKEALYQKVREVGKGFFDMKVGGENCTVFTDEVMGQWNLVIVIKDSELYKQPRWLMLVSIMITLIVFILISMFYLLSYRNERRYNIRMQKMKEVERQKDYEAKVLKLEKSAADSANKAKSHFLADMSHEIRTPINAILGMNEMILHESKEEGTREYATNIKSAGNTLLSIINTILDFSKIEDGKMSLVPVEFETAKLVNDLVNSISERAKAKELELKVDIDESVPSKLLGDDVRISQVIMNLLTNAVKYTEKGYVMLRMKNLGEKNGKCNIRVSVKDTGIGIRKEDINRLSISFERVDEKKNRHIEGTGLGISIVTRLLNMMGGGLKVESTYGEGSDFSFELPVEVADATPIGKFDSEKRTVPVSAGDSVTLYAPRARILLTDDNEMNCKVAAKLMKLFGIQPTLCRSGQATIEAMKKGTYDILFLDHMMPEMDGLETLQNLEDDSLIGDTKVIALTANAVVGAKEQYLAVGFTDYLAKPIRLPELDQMLRKYLPEELIEAPPAEDTPEETSKEAPPVTKASDGAPAEGQSITQPITQPAPDAPDESPSKKDAVEPAEITYEGWLGQLQGMGICVEDGLTYCADDESFYLEMLKGYITVAPEKTAELGNFLQEENLKEYKVLVHSLKSSSKTIGSMPLYEKALELEQAAKDGDLDFVREHHQPLMDAYHTLADAIGKVLDSKTDS
ncbi:MAG: response regulator [Eubacterium sp.]|nr:response regulator [Eubacterium sp.]